MDLDEQTKGSFTKLRNATKTVWKKYFKDVEKHKQKWGYNYGLILLTSLIKNM